MKRPSLSRVSISCCIAVALGWASGSVAAPIQPGENVQDELQEALILVEEGGVIELGEGVFEFVGSLSLDVDGVTLRGQGIDKTILSFKNQDAGSEGLIVTSSGVTLRDFAVEDTIGDAIKVKGAKGISFYNVRAEWTGGPKETNGAYGLYPVESENVLIDGCVAIGASDAGIYVGQSRNVIVRNSTAKYNVAGIEIENCYNADVYNNLATHNTGGILIFDLPNLPQQGGHNVRVFNNRSVDNDTPNFAPKGNIVGTVPTGSGLIIMANRNVEVFGNEFSGNGTFNISVTAYMAGPDEKVDPNYYPYPEGIYIHDNTFGTGGYKPMGVLGMLAAQAAKSSTLGDIMWDGRMNPEKTKDGKLPESDWIYIKESADTEFINIDLGTFMTNPEASNPSRDVSAHEGELPRLPAVKLPQDMEDTD